MTPDTKQAHTPTDARKYFDRVDGDNGRELACRMADDKLSAILKTLRHVRATLDNDEDGASFEVDHNEFCPAARYPSPHAPPNHRHGGACVCGLYDMITELIEAEADANNVREQLALLGRRR